jgi:hypothetical protein
MADASVDAIGEVLPSDDPLDRVIIYCGTLIYLFNLDYF